MITRRWWIVDSLMSGHRWISDGPLNPLHQEKSAEVQVCPVAELDEALAKLKAAEGERDQLLITNDVSSKLVDRLKAALPSCMIPDGADACDAFQKLTFAKQEIEKLHANIRQLKGRVRFLEKECSLRIRQRENALERVMPYQDQLEREREITAMLRDALEDCMDTIKRQWGNTHPEFTAAWDALARELSMRNEKK